MKAIFEFDMNEPDDIMAHLSCTKSLDIVLVLWDIIYNSKKGFEWNIEANEYETQYDLLNAIYKKIWEELKERNVNLEELVN
jgi:hypothetical protein